MSCHDRQAKFYFRDRDDATAQRPPHGGNNNDRLPVTSDENIGALTPLPAVRRFTSLGVDDKRAVLSDAILNRLTSATNGDRPGITDALIAHYNGREAELYDVLQNDALQDVVGSLAPDAVSPQSHASMHADFEVGDIIDCWSHSLNTGGPGGTTTSPPGALVRINKIAEPCSGKPHQIVGEFIIPDGQNSVCVFRRPAEITRVTDVRGDNYVISHPAAKILYKRASGAKWFSCKKDGTDQALIKATETMKQWEIDFKRRSEELMKAKICICKNKTCPYIESPATLHVHDYVVIPRRGLGAAVLGKIDADMHVGEKRAGDSIIRERHKAVKSRLRPGEAAGAQGPQKQ